MPETKKKFPIEVDAVDITELVTVVAVAVLAYAAVGAGSDELASALGGGLVGYLTKSAVQAIKGPK